MPWPVVIRGNGVGLPSPLATLHKPLSLQSQINSRRNAPTFLLPRTPQRKFLTAATGYEWDDVDLLNIELYMMLKLIIELVVADIPECTSMWPISTGTPKPDFWIIDAKSGQCRLTIRLTREFA